MFPLRIRELPVDAAALAAALTQSLAEIVSGTTDDLVEVVGDNFPAVDLIRVNLDGAILRTQPPRILQAVGETSPAFTCSIVEISGRGMRLADAPLDLLLKAEAIELHQARDAAGEVGLLFQRARHGEARISVSPRDLEALITRFAQKEAGRQGVKIETVQLRIRSTTPRSLECEIEVRAKKLFLSALVKVAGRIDLDDALVATISGLSCSGEGALGGLASSFLTPHLQRLEGRRFELMALPLGEIRLRDVGVTVGDRIELRARFGAEV